jgi:uncharacterized protein YbjQ (UPF0145 family)
VALRLGHRPVLEDGVKRVAQPLRVLRRILMLADGRQHATERLIEEAEAKGANAILAFRFDTSELGSSWTEIFAYGTAVRATKR